ncbi:hypothetical protein IR083_19765 [Dysgonomonas sp. GY75]|uniref:hypothetical protein n=1 Tax=Dysgonomonas sp. GY75 TaxID=2780419 RepID=UPI001883D005|nr:hypothetical protein [Dysgonomonas sp. GY75]MBF0651058.1 hypothetical protein [Dysgonomonas sp. GY75]
MPKIKTPAGGITTTSTYGEGDMYSLVNLRPKNGALHPVSPRKVVQELSRSYDIVFLHQNNSYKNWIGIVNQNDHALVYWDILNENPKPVQSNLQGSIHSIEQIGNTLSLITSDNIYYLFFQNNNYTFLGELPQVPAIGLRTSDQMAHAELFFDNEYEPGSVRPEDFTDATKGLVHVAMNKVNEAYGLHLFDACFIRYAFRLYDGTVTKHSPPVLIMPSRPVTGDPAISRTGATKDSVKWIQYEINNDGNRWYVASWSRVHVYGYKIHMHYGFAFDGWQDWQDIIKSVDIFMSPPLGLSNIENIRGDMPYDLDILTGCNLVKEIKPETLKNVSNTSTFYFMKSIELGKEAGILDPEVFPSTDSDITKMENLIYQEVMTDDQFSNHKYGAEVSYTYNNRLHIANIKTTFFKGFNPDYFLWYNTSGAADGNYNGYKYADAGGPLWNNLLFEVEINTGITNERLYRYVAGVPYFPVYKMFMSAFISYPDTRAKRITIYRQTGGQWYRVFTRPLEPHHFLNLAYFINDGLKPVTEDSNPSSAVLPDTNTVVTLSEPDKIKVSALDNPLLFPNINTYQAGNGTILAMAANAIRISEGQFGQYPLYIFTTRGIYSLDVGQGEVVYSNKSAPASYEIPASPVVCSTPFGVVFTSERGVCIIRGQEVELLTTQLQEDRRDLNIGLLPQMEGVIHISGLKTLAGYLRGLDNLVYDPYENELLICNQEYGFNYVLNFYSGLFYQSTEKIDLAVGNTFPELYVVEGNRLKNYESGNLNEDGTPQRADVSFIMRPLQYGVPYIKWLEKIQMFCTLYDAGPLVYIAHSSMDGINFKAVSGMAPAQRGNYSTLETRRIAGNKFRDFLFSFGASLAPGSMINYLESWVDEGYKDRLMK